MRLDRQQGGEVIWSALGTNEEMKFIEGKREENQLAYLAYAVQDDNLLIRLILKRRILKNFGVSVDLLGYSNKLDFANMPKIQLNIGFGGLHLKRKEADLVYQGCKATR